MNSFKIPYTCSLHVSYSFLTGAAAGCDGFCCCAAVEDCSFSFFKAASLSALSLAICSLTLSLINEQYYPDNHYTISKELLLDTTLHVFLLIFLSSSLQLVSLLLLKPYCNIIIGEPICKIINTSEYTEKVDQITTLYSLLEQSLIHNDNKLYFY